MKRFLFALILAGAAYAAPSQFPNPVGNWMIYHTDGAPIRVTLYPDHKAVSSWGDEGQKGRWEIVHGRLVMRWSDGWRDVVSLYEGRYEKLGYAPGNRDQAKPSNRTAAIKVSD